MQIANYLMHGHNWILPVFLLSGAILFSNVVHGITFAIIKRRRKDATPQQNAARPSIYRHLNHPARWVFLTICVLSTFPWLPIPGQIATPLRLTLHIILVVLSGWFAVGCVYVMQDALARRYDIKAENNVRARRIHTQMQVLRRLLIGFIVIIDIGCLLWTFPDPQLWHYGSGLLASAGVATLVLATALKPTVGNLLAGLQIAFAEPIRIDDVVIVQGEWGRIEEITTTYVVVCIWDLRRLIVPLSYFIENPFQNWTRERSDLLGTAFLYTDYSVPVAAIREHFAKVLEGISAVGPEGVLDAGDEPERAHNGNPLPDERAQFERAVRPAVPGARGDGAVHSGELSGRFSAHAIFVAAEFGRGGFGAGC